MKYDRMNVLINSLSSKGVSTNFQSLRDKVRNILEFMEKRLNFFFQVLNSQNITKGYFY